MYGSSIHSNTATTLDTRSSLWPWCVHPAAVRPHTRIWYDLFHANASKDIKKHHIKSTSHRVRQVSPKRFSFTYTSIKALFLPSAQPNLIQDPSLPFWSRHSVEGESSITFPFLWIPLRWCHEQVYVTTPCGNGFCSTRLCLQPTGSLYTAEVSTPWGQVCTSATPDPWDTRGLNSTLCVTAVEALFSRGGRIDTPLSSYRRPSFLKKNGVKHYKEITDSSYSCMIFFFF